MKSVVHLTFHSSPTHQLSPTTSKNSRTSQTVFGWETQQDPVCSQHPSVGSLFYFNLQAITTPGYSQPAVFGDLFIVVVCGNDDAPDLDIST
jgi:hypothetical protein